MSIATVHRPRPESARAAVAAAAILAALAGAVALAVDVAHDGTTLLDTLIFVRALAFVAGGLVAWRHRRSAWAGNLMIATGLVLFVGTLTRSSASLPFTIGAAVGALPFAVLGHLILAFPDGRLHSRAERGLVIAAYITATAGQVVMLMFMSFGDAGPDNLLLVRDSMTVHAIAMHGEQVVSLILALAAAVIVVGRVRRATAPMRRAIAPIAFTGALTMALLGIVLLTPGESQTTLLSLDAIAFAAVPVAYLFGLLRARLARVAVSDLVVGLAQQTHPGQLRDALARALRDPSLELVYWVPAISGYVGIDGSGADLRPRPGQTVRVIERRGEPVAALVHDEALAEDPALLDAVSSAAGLALENERLLAELRAQLDVLRESRARIVEAGDTERRRLERNLHDGAQQRLVSIALVLGLAREKVRSDPDGTEQMLASAREEMAAALQELRELAEGLHPAALTERGLAFALSGLAERSPVPVELDVRIPERPPAAIEAAGYYVVAEALANVAKYAQASSVRVSATSNGHVLRVEVVDDGIGGADTHSGSGLRGLDDRVQAFGGRLLLSSPAGRGTRLGAELPLS